MISKPTQAKQILVLTWKGFLNHEFLAYHLFVGFFFLTTYRCKEEVKIGDNGVEHDDCKRINQLSSKCELCILDILNDL